MIQFHLSNREITNLYFQMSCSKCSHGAENGKLLFDHIFAEHMKETRLFCSTCEYQGNTPSAVLLHFTRAHEFDKEMCPECGKVVRSLAQHKAIHNPELCRQHKCDECGKGFASNVDLRRHEMIHSGLKPHACTGEERIELRRPSTDDSLPIIF